MRWWRKLVWLYDGRPDLSRPDPMFVVTGWGPVRLPGEKAHIQRIEDETKALLDGAPSGYPWRSELDALDKRARERESE